MQATLNGTTPQFENLNLKLDGNAHEFIAGIKTVFDFRDEEHKLQSVEKQATNRWDWIINGSANWKSLNLSLIHILILSLLGYKQLKDDGFDVRPIHSPFRKWRDVYKRQKASTAPAGTALGKLTARAMVSAASIKIAPSNIAMGRDFRKS